MRDGHITGVEMLKRDNDKGLIKQAKDAFAKKGEKYGAEGFEVWDELRFVFRFPADLKTRQAPSGSSLPS